MVNPEAAGVYIYMYSSSLSHSPLYVVYMQARAFAEVEGMYSDYVGIFDNPGGRWSPLYTVYIRHLLMGIVPFGLSWNNTIYGALSGLSFLYQID